MPRFLPETSPDQADSAFPDGRPGLRPAPDPFPRGPLDPARDSRTFQRINDVQIVARILLAWRPLWTSAPASIAFGTVADNNEVVLTPTAPCSRSTADICPSFTRQETTTPLGRT